MRVTTTALSGVLVLEPSVFRDPRGFFFESFNQRAFDVAVGRHVEFVQDNHSRSGKGVLRGLHYQLPPHAQGKLVRVAYGRVFDAVVDLRTGSSTHGQWFGIELNHDNRLQLWIPAGFAHGFLVLSESAEFLYKTSEYYAPAAERSLRWDDPAIGIRWPLSGVTPTLSEKDATAPSLAEAARFD